MFCSLFPTNRSMRSTCFLSKGEEKPSFAQALPENTKDPRQAPRAAIFTILWLAIFTGRRLIVEIACGESKVKGQRKAWGE